MCKKTLPKLERQCPGCRTDLGLLVEYTDHLHTGLERADERTRAGALGEAVWEYLQVLEVDPDHPVARRQVSQVVTAVRQFDQAAPGRRWLSKMRRREKYQRWVDSTVGETPSGRWLTFGVLLLLLLVAAAAGFLGGYEYRQNNPPAEVDGE
ncbi:MAG: hypothetical protein K2R98_09595 [Gemmataceae bacterium]|nr:hypothetical protein [Gemmataceae bacterium]